MIKFFKLSGTLPLLAVLLTSTLAAQSKVVATQTDEKFAQTTVVYKNEGGIDAEILAQLEGSYGISDVVRVAVATPKPTPVTAPLATPKTAPVVAATPPTPVNLAATRNMVASDDLAVVLADTKSGSVAPVETLTTSVTYVTENNFPTAESASATTTPTNFSFLLPDTQQNVQIATGNMTTKTFKTVKKVTTTKSVKKSRSTQKKSSPAKLKKSHKRGKQQYGCFRF